MAFLEVLVERPETARLLIERLGDWRRMMEYIEDGTRGSTMTAAEFFQKALNGGGGTPALPFGRSGSGVYRKATHRDRFGEALYRYLLKVKEHISPLELASDNWETALTRVGNHDIPSFGPLARFNFLERLCLLGVTSPPDQYLPSGGGPVKGFLMIYGTSENMISDGTRMLRMLTERTGNKLSLFALETFLCTMQKSRFKHCFVELFRAPYSEEAVRQAVDCYLGARG